MVTLHANIDKRDGRLVTLHANIDQRDGRLVAGTPKLGSPKKGCEEKQ